MQRSLVISSSVVVILVMAIFAALLAMRMKTSTQPTYVCYNFLQVLAHHRVDLPHETKHLYAFDKNAVFDPSAVSPGANVVFVKTDLLDDFVDRSMPNISSSFVLITGNSDLSPSDYSTKRILANNLVSQWASTNVSNRHASSITVGMPIGLSEPDRPIGDQAISRVMRMRLPKKRRVLIPPCGKTHPIRFDVENFRHPLVDGIAGGKKTFEDYLGIMATYEWVVCPRGNGIDVHRVWEALLLRCIPIYVADSYSNVPLVYKKFPVAVTTVDDLQKTIESMPTFEHVDWDDVHHRLTIRSYSF